jgi:CRISPR-associated endonuclease/helicase Cas3
MNILLVSQCAKRALIETRRILDQFAERKGERVWQTPITELGLDTLRKLLRKTARKNTAVACHWIRGINKTELLWIVGDAAQFNHLGTVPTNTTEADVLRAKDENEWHTLTLIQQISELASLWHDFGKASRLFQKKLQLEAIVADPYRHEWVSVRLLQAFVGTDDDRTWLSRLQSIESEDSSWTSRLARDGVDANPDKPFASLPPIAKLVAWMVLSHHRLPSHRATGAEEGQISDQAINTVWQHLDATWASSNPKALSSAGDCWVFDGGLPTQSATWRHRASALAKALLERSQHEPTASLTNPFAAHIARLCLIAGDHHFSSLEGDTKQRDKHYAVYANTRHDGTLKQRLDEHLIGVARWSKKLCLQFPVLDETFPRLIHRAFRKRSDVSAFRWQNTAFDLARGLSLESKHQGFFGVNMASTGTGKTLANARIMYGLADHPLGARFVVALGLRTLTLQTGDALRQRIGLTDDDLAVMVGSSAVRALHRLKRQDAESAHKEIERSELETPIVRGSESAEPLLETAISVRYDGALAGGPWGEVLAKDPHALKLLSAPVLVCTIDHLMPASETTRGGHHIPPMLRLLTSDLVIDEADDFDLNDIPALSRLVFFAGLLGSRVLLSSATLPPALVQGLFEAYRVGRASFRKNVGAPDAQKGIACAWFDEFGAASNECGDESAYRAQHDAFVDKRIAALADATRTKRRIAKIHELELKVPQHPTEKLPKPFAEELVSLAKELHASNHEDDSATNKRVSFGLIRMANIEPIIAVARRIIAIEALADTQVHVCVYHSRFPLFLRSAIEARLDDVLKRHIPNAVFADPHIRDALAKSMATNHIFIVLASPVAEVGRDHDYDWAIVEPSSMRSIIQLAGRVRRHRPEPVSETNIILLNKNYKALVGKDELVFVKPGFEHKSLKLNSRDLAKLLATKDYLPLNASPRIRERTESPGTNLVDLEHTRLRALLIDDRDKLYNIRRYWHGLSNDAGRHYTAYDIEQAEFRDGEPQTEFYLWPQEDGNKHFRFERKASDAKQKVEELALEQNDAVLQWGAPSNLRDAFMEFRAFGGDEQQLAKRFGSFSLSKSAAEKPIYWHPWIGYTSKQNF